MSGLFAVVANSLAFSLSGAVARDVSNLSTVVALLSMGAVASHVTESAAGVASLLAPAESTAISACITALRAVTSNVTNPSTLVALLAASGAAEALSRGCLGAFARDVSGSTAAITRLLLGSYCAFTADMALSTAVVASRGTLLGTVTGLMRSFTTVKASTTSSLETHIGRMNGIDDLKKEK